MITTKKILSSIFFSDIVKMMKFNKPNVEPSGIELLRYFYALTSLLSGVHLIFFLKYTNIFWFDSILAEPNNAIAILVLGIIPLLLYFGFKYPTLPIWCMAFAYHIFFTLNSFLGVVFALNNNFFIKPMLRITGKSATPSTLSGDTALRLFTIFNINLFMGIIILWYLWRQRRYFESR